MNFSLGRKLVEKKTQKTNPKFDKELVRKKTEEINDILFKNKAGIEFGEIIDSIIFR